MSSADNRAYKDFIDGLASLAASVAGARIRKGEPIFTGFADKNEKYNQLLSKLDSETREMVADLLDQADSGGIHDSLAFLEAGNYRISHEGASLPHQPFGTELFFDFVSRREGDPWPE